MRFGVRCVGAPSTLFAQAATSKDCAASNKECASLIRVWHSVVGRRKAIFDSSHARKRICRRVVGNER